MTSVVAGDCRAIITTSDAGETRCTPLSHDHNSDNVNELNRILSEHPAAEQNSVIRYNRLLGQLMPLRAFGDFGYKWQVSRIKSVGLTKAYGPHVIPPFYQTPPYLTCEPEVTRYDRSLLARDSESFVILATDGLWEQFDSSRVVAEHLWKHRGLKRAMAADGACLEHQDTVGGAVGTVETPAVDGNSATFLLRSALSQPFDHEQHSPSHQSASEQRRLEHRKLVSFLTLPSSVVRNFRDDISLIVARL